MKFVIIRSCSYISFLMLTIVRGSSLATTVDKKEIESKSKTCEQCEDGLNQLRKELDSLKEHKDKELLQQLKEMQTKLNSVMGAAMTGVSYVRWGRTICPTPATMVYAGHVGGAGRKDNGGGVNYLCLPHHPEWGNRMDGLNEWHSKLYGSEYEHTLPPIFSLDNNGGQSLYDLDALCTMCFVPNRSAQIMIPAKRTCPEGWTMEYRGYLATDMNQFSSKEFVCLDEAPEGLTGSYASLNGALFYPVEGVCGSLPCPPYVNGWELAYVVCSK